MNPFATFTELNVTQRIAYGSDNISELDNSYMAIHNLQMSKDRTRAHMDTMDAGYFLQSLAHGLILPLLLDDEEDLLEDIRVLKSRLIFYNQ